VFAKYGAGVGVNLALPRHAHPGALEPEIEAADPGEQRSDFHCSSLSRRWFRDMVDEYGFANE
jgi:hypothetical protein